MNFDDLTLLHLQSPSLCEWLQVHTGVEEWVVQSGIVGFTAKYGMVELSPQPSASAAMAAWEKELRGRGIWQD